ncbi:MAG: hypothetical protein M1814_001018 [Vezdaea aestivalis]|nr:MAG: hypothetical protein M1814_001018 [Vezdaea aestivalis]
MSLSTGDDKGNPFSLSGLWRPSIFSKGEVPSPTLFPIPDIYSIQKGSNPLTLPTVYAQPLPQSRLPSSAASLAESEPALTHSSDASSDEEAPVGPLQVELEPEPEKIEKDDGFDPWCLPSVVSPPIVPELRTWESFLATSRQQPRLSHLPGPTRAQTSSYLSEAPVLVLSAALSQSPALGPGTLLPCLLSLGLGRSSILFQRDISSPDPTFLRSTKISSESFRLPDLRSQTLTPLIDKLSAHATRTSRIEAFIKRVRTRPPSPTCLALSSALSIIMSTLSSHIARSGDTISTPLRLRALFARPIELLESLDRLINAIEEDGEMDDLETLFKAAETSQYQAEWLQSVYLELLRVVSRPFVDSLSSWVGLSGQSQGLSTVPPSFLKQKPQVAAERSAVPLTFKPIVGGKGEVIDEKREEEWVIDSTHSLPPYVSTKLAQTILGAGKCLRFLRRYNPAHPLCNSPQFLSKDYKLEWGFSWADAERAQDITCEYGRAVHTAIATFDANGSLLSTSAHNQETGPTTSNDTDILGLSASVQEFFIQHKPLRPPPLPSLLHPFSQFLQSQLQSRPVLAFTIPPPLSQTPSLTLHPLLTAHTLHLTQATLHQLFNYHALLPHLSLLRAFPLLTSPPLTTSLFQALSAPPANTALAAAHFRLNLSRLLDDAFWSTPSLTLLRTRTGALPADLEFVVRASAEGDDVGLLKGLHIRFVPPPALRDVISNRSVELSERCFEVLCAGLRIRGRLKGVFGRCAGRGVELRLGMRRAWVEINWFVDTIGAYFGEVVGIIWSPFETKVEGLKVRVEERRTETTDGPATLRTWLDSTLESIAGALLARKGQAKASRALERVWAEVDRFVAAVEGGINLEPAFHTAFRDRVEEVRSVCAELGGKRREGITNNRGGSQGRDKEQDVEAADLLAMLATRLDRGWPSGR